MGRQLDNFEVEALAMAAHENNRAFCQAMGDFSHSTWDATPDDLRQIARQAVIGIATLDFTPEQTHEAWVAAKRAAGWRHGDTKNAKDKTHPCLVAWKDLPFEQQVKDEMWISTVKNLLAAIWRIPRQ